MTKETTVLCSIEDGIATVTLNRPDKMNALSEALIQSLIDTGEQLKKDNSVRVVVLHGEGNNFSAGLDVELFKKFGVKDQNLAERTHGISNWFQQVVWVWREVPVPVIAAVKGVAFGGGLQVACAADMRYVHPDAQMSIMEVKWGLIADMAGSQLWNHYVKQDLIRELSFTGEVFSGKQAMDYGFCTRLSDDPLALAKQTAKQICLKSPDAIRAYKRLINKQAYVDAATGLLEESIEQDKIVGFANQVEAVTANLQKREPNFTDPEA